MKKHILFIASLAAMVACSRNEGPADNNPGNVTLIVKDFVDAKSGNPFTSDQQTRSTLSIDNSGVNFSFTNGDVLGVFPNETYTQQLRIKTNIEEGEAPEFSGATVGWLLGEDIDYAAYYPFQADYHLNPGEVTFNYTGQMQNGNGNAADNQAHLGSYDYLYSNVQTPQDNQITFTLSHAGAILHIRHLDTNGGEYESLTISAGGEEVIPTSVTINLFGNRQLTSGGYASSLEIGLSEFEATAGSNLNVWCMLPPADLSGKTLQFTFTGKNETLDCSFTMPGKNLEAGNLYDFIEHVYALRYNAGDGEFEGGVKQYTEIRIAEDASCEFTVTDKEPVLAGYKLTGWSEIEGGEVVATAGETYTVENTDWQTSDKVANLYAVYEEAQGQVTVSVEADPAVGGAVHIDGEPLSSKNVDPGTQVSLQAIPNLGFKFSKWSDGWLEESRVETINNKVTYTAEFTKLIVVNVASSDLSTGSVTGGGYYSPDDDVTIEATPDSGYEFEKWIVSASGAEITDNPYGFTAEADISFTAYFKEAAPQADGSLPGEFSVSATKKVKFSQGNLQYQASTNTWRFAEHQYDHIGDGGTKAGNVAGSDNTQISSTYSGWIDLFGWGTSGGGQSRLDSEYYLPYSGSTTTASLWYINGVRTNLTLSTTTGTDWGCNDIYIYNTGVKGVKSNLSWRTLTSTEATYLLSPNGGSTDGRGGYRFLQVNAVIGTQTIFGILVFPDIWSPEMWPSSSQPESTAYNIKTKTPTTCSEEVFTKLQKLDVVFLPQSGYRKLSSKKETLYSPSYVFYWLSDSGNTSQTNSNAIYTSYSNSTYNINIDNSSRYRYYGQAVRLVTDVPSE